MKKRRSTSKALTTHKVAPREIEIAKQIPSFTFLKTDTKRLNKLLSISRDYNVPSGTLIVKEGEESTEIYILVSGKVSIRRRDRQVNMHEAGIAFGEIGVLQNEQRYFTIQAVTDVELLAIDSKSLKKALKEDKELERKLYKGIAKELSKKLKEVAVFQDRVFDLGDEILANLCTFKNAPPARE